MMITSSFTEWVKEHQLNEVQVEGDIPANMFGNLLQKEGDIALFDLHRLSDLAKELPKGQSFQPLSLKERADKIGYIIGAIPVKRKVIITRPATVSSYRRLKKLRGQKFNISLNSLRNVTELFPESETNGKSVWLVVDDKTAYQGQLEEAINRAIQTKYNQPTSPVEPEPEPESFEDMFPASAAQIPTQSEPPRLDLDTLVPPDEPPKGPLRVWKDRNQERVNFQQLGEPKYQMQNRNVIPTNSTQMAALGQGLRYHRSRTPVDSEIERVKALLKVNSFDPSILSNDRHWKIYTEAKTYAYR